LVVIADTIRNAVVKKGSDVNLDLLNLRQLPMIAPPLPWVTHNRGGYFQNTSMLCRLSRHRTISESGFSVILGHL
jgi:DNA-directed RNA polymerase